MQQDTTPEAGRPEFPAEPSGEPRTAGSTRRGMLAGAGLAGLAGLAGAAATACGTADDGATGTPAGGGATGTPGGSAAGAGATGGGTGESGTGGGVGVALAKVSEIPVGGGKIISAQKIVITQPVQGTFKAFSATCTHRGCTVGSVAGGTINCPCHGSKYSISDASVAGGPAPEPLPAKQIVVTGDEIKLA